MELYGGKGEEGEMKMRGSSTFGPWRQKWPCLQNILATKIENKTTSVLSANLDICNFDNCSQLFVHWQPKLPVTNSSIKFISSRLDYCNSLLYGASDDLIRKLQWILNAAAHLITGDRRCDLITHAFCWLSGVQVACLEVVSPRHRLPHW